MTCRINIVCLEFELDSCNIIITSSQNIMCTKSFDTADHFWLFHKILSLDMCLVLIENLILHIAF